MRTIAVLMTLSVFQFCVFPAEAEFVLDRYHWVTKVSPEEGEKGKEKLIRLLRADPSTGAKVLLENAEPDMVAIESALKSGPLNLEFRYCILGITNFVDSCARTRNETLISTFRTIIKESRSPLMRSTTCIALQHLDSASAIPLLTLALDDSDSTVRLEAILLLTRFEQFQAILNKPQLLHNADMHSRVAIVSVYCKSQRIDPPENPFRARSLEEFTTRMKEVDILFSKIKNKDDGKGQF